MLPVTAACAVRGARARAATSNAPPAMRVKLRLRLSFQYSRASNSLSSPQGRSRCGARGCRELGEVERAADGLGGDHVELESGGDGRRGTADVGVLDRHLVVTGRPDADRDREDVERGARRGAGEA